MQKEKFITDEPKTSIRKDHHGWNGETYVKIKGYCYMITTIKGYSGFIVSTARKVNDEGSSNGMRGVSFMLYGGDEWALAKEKATATETKIREVHTASVNKFLAMDAELPSKEEAYQIKPGQVIISVGYALSEGSNEVVYKVDDDDYFFVNKETLELGRCNLSLLRDIRKQFGIGRYYEEGDMMDVDIVNDLVMDAIEKKKRDEEERPAREAAAKAEREAAIAELKAEYPYLIERTDKSGGTFAAQNIRIEFKRNFPNVKFSITSDYGKVDINWLDGPTTESVAKITSKYEDHKTDITGDYRDPDPSLFNNVFGGCKYVFEQRSMKPETERVLMQWANERFDKGEKYDTHYAGNLAYRLFCDYEIPANGFEIMPKQTTGGINRPATFWEIVPAPDSAVSTKPETTVQHVTAGSAKVSINPEKDGIEISFPTKPSDEMLANLKSAGFRWSRFNRVWWAKRTPELQERVKSLLKA